MSGAVSLAEALQRLGCSIVFGTPIRDARVVAADATVAQRCAQAAGRLSGVGVAHCGDGVLVVSGGPGPERSCVVGHARELAEAVRDAWEHALAPVPGSTRLRCAFDLTDVALDPDALSDPTLPPRWVEPDDDAIARIDAATHPVVLAGPGVVRAGCIAGLQAFAARRSLGVLNTWGAKGVFDWRSRHHLATAGLQARDWELAGFGDADLVVAVGVDPGEAPGEWALAPVVTLEPGMLAPLAECLGARNAAVERPPLFARLASLTQRGWSDDRVPLAPTRITKHYGEVLGRRGLVAADPGTSGFFVARTFATTEPGSVLVPGDAATAGFAAAVALVDALSHRRRRVLGVVDAPVDDTTRHVLDVAAGADVGIALEVWDPDGDVLGPDAHRDALVRAVGAPAPPRRVAFASGQLDEFVAAAGPVVAWTEVAGREGAP